MEIGISTACFYPMDTAQSLIRCGELGFHVCELFVNAFSELKRPYVKKLKQIAEHFGIRLYSAHMFTAALEGLLFFSGYERRLSDSLDLYRSCFEQLAYLGIGSLTLHGERQFVSPLGETDIEHTVEVFHKLCGCGAPYGVQISQENVSWCRSSDPAYVHTVLKKVPELKFTLDLKQARRVSTNYHQYLDKIGSRVSNIHISDFDHQKSCMLPGKGLFDWSEFFETLEHIKYDRTLMIEVYSSDFKQDQEVMDARAFLEDKLSR